MGKKSGGIDMNVEEWLMMNPNSPFMPVQNCRNCNSDQLDHDEEQERVSCRKCGSSFGGAGFWEWVGDHK